MFSRAVSGVVVCAAVLVPGTALAQWSNDPNVNLAVAAKTAEQVQPKIGTLSDGSAYVSWLDNDPTGSPAYGYDVFLQYLDADGVPQWDPNGVRIADRGYSSTTDYGFAVDASGNALLAFRDDRSGTEQITVTKVSTAGTQVWGPMGVQVSSGTDPKYAPDVAATSDGNVAVGWSGSGRKGLPAAFVTVVDASGATLWSDTINSDKNYTYAFSHLAAGTDGSVIALWVRTTNSLFFPTRQLVAQKYNTKGRPLWHKGVVVADGASLQGGEFPKVASDDAGGAIVGWYTTGVLESYVQHINAAGDEMFPHNGVAAATNPDTRTEPSFAFDAATGDIVMVYHESGAGDGVYGQRFSPTGARLWTDNGVAIRPLGSASILWPTVVDTPTGALVTWIEQVGYPDAEIYGAKLDASGALTCDGIAVSLAPGNKNRIAAAPTPAGGGVFAWEDGRSDFSDVYAQRIGADCSLGLAQ